MPYESVEESPSFGAILEGLRSIEDSFHFLIQEGPQAGTSIPVHDAEMILGWDESRQNLSSDLETIAQPQVLVRKDWTGVMVQPQKGVPVMLNGQPLSSAQRLRNGDRLLLEGDDPASRAYQVLLVFNEPASLVVLDTLLPNRLPPPVPAAREPRIPEGGDITTDEQMRQVPDERIYFGHFSFFELLIMTFGTLVLAAIIFFVLDNA